MTEKAFAKLNLTLEVLGRRDDGYHDLRMVMCSVALHDVVELRFDGNPDVCSVSTAFGSDVIPEGRDNLAYRAATAYAEAAGLSTDGLSIRIEKRIPAQAGMAGGSSDAAAVLRALNRRFGAFSDEKLRAIGLTLGSDVPYCLFGGVALAEGRGERLTRLPALPEGLCFVLIKPDFSVSTPALFRALDATAGQGSGIGAAASKAEAMLAALQSGDAGAIGAALHNDFTAVLKQTHPVVTEGRRFLLRHGARGAELTGTGSVVFGVFDDRRTAERAAEAIRMQTGWFSTVTVPVPVR